MDVRQRPNNYTAIDDPLRALDRFVRHVGQRQATERKADAAANPLAGDVDELERTTAKVTDDSIGLIHGRDDAERRQLCLVRS